MKKFTLGTVAAFFIFAFAGNILGYEGGTKWVATLTHPEEMSMTSGPLFLVSYQHLSPGKMIERYLHRMPEPTLSAAGIREERPGLSLGTKIHVRYLKKGRV